MLASTECWGQREKKNEIENFEPSGWQTSRRAAGGGGKYVSRCVFLICFVFCFDLEKAWDGNCEKDAGYITLSLLDVKQHIDKIDLIY
jgi:hypothetical protein